MCIHICVCVQLRPQFLESEEGVKIVEKYEQIVRVLEHFMQETFDEWAEKVDSVSVTKLDEPLLKRCVFWLPLFVGDGWKEMSSLPCYVLHPFAVWLGGLYLCIFFPSCSL